MDTKPINRERYGGFDEQLRELGKEDPEVYKHWHDWYKPKAEQPLWLKPDSPESLEKLLEVLNLAIKERRWTHEPIREGTQQNLDGLRGSEGWYSSLRQRVFGWRSLAGSISVRPERMPGG